MLLGTKQEQDAVIKSSAGRAQLNHVDVVEKEETEVDEAAKQEFDSEEMQSSSAPWRFFHFSKIKK